MNRRRNKAALIVSGTIILLGFVAAARFIWALDVLHEVTNTITRSEEIGFGPVGKTDQLGRWIHKKLPVAKVFHRASFDIAFRNTKDIELWYFNDLTGDLGKSLQQFHGLEKICIVATEGMGPTQKEWNRLCRTLANMKSLQEIELGGSHLLPEDVALLSKIPHLKHLRIYYGASSPDWQSLAMSKFNNVDIEFEIEPEYFKEIESVLLQGTLTPFATLMLGAHQAVNSTVYSRSATSDRVSL